MFTTLVFTAQSGKFEKFVNIRWNTKSSRRSFITALELFCKNFVDISYKNALLHILEDSVWLQLVYFLTTIVFFFVKYLFPIVGDNLN